MGPKGEKERMRTSTCGAAELSLIPESNVGELMALLLESFSLPLSFFTELHC